MTSPVTPRDQHRREFPRGIAALAGRSRGTVDTKRKLEEQLA